MVLSRDRFHSDVHVLLQSPTSSQTSRSLLLLCACIHVLVVDGPHASTEALLSDCPSGLGHINGNKAPGTGALEESMWEVCSNILCEQDLTQQLTQHKSQSNE